MPTVPNKPATAFVVGTLALGALAFGAFGVQWLLDPVAMANPLGIHLTNSDATSDARAVYGGLELGVGLFLSWCVASADRRTLGLTALALCLFGLGFSRLTGIVLAPDVTSATWQLLATDLGGAVLCTVALLVSRSVSPK